MIAEKMLFEAAFQMSYLHKMVVPMRALCACWLAICIWEGLGCEACSFRAVGCVNVMKILLSNKLVHTHGGVGLSPLQYNDGQTS